MTSAGASGQRTGELHKPEAQVGDDSFEPLLKSPRLRSFAIRSSEGEERSCSGGAIAMAISRRFGRRRSVILRQGGDVEGCERCHDD